MEGNERIIRREEPCFHSARTCNRVFVEHVFVGHVGVLRGGKRSHCRDVKRFSIVFADTSVYCN